jgi:hypothetical protein
VIAAIATQLATKFDHATHYIIALYLCGHAKPEDNGYLIYCLPKSKVTKEAAIEATEKLSREMGIIFTVKPVPRGSSRN